MEMTNCHPCAVSFCKIETKDDFATNYRFKFMSITSWVTENAGHKNIRFVNVGGVGSASL